MRISELSRMNDFLAYLKTLGEKLKNTINNTRIPSLLSFIITKDGKINPTLEESLKEASPKEANWTRLGLDKSVFGLPVWFIILIPILVIAIRYASEALQFFIQIISQFAALIPLAIVLYFIIKFWKKK